MPIIPLNLSSKQLKRLKQITESLELPNVFITLRNALSIYSILEKISEGGQKEVYIVYGKENPFKVTITGNQIVINTNEVKVKRIPIEKKRY